MKMPASPIPESIADAPGAAAERDVPNMAATKSGKPMRRLLCTRYLGLPAGDFSTLEDSHVTLIGAVAQHFHVRLGTKELLAMKNVGDLLRAIQRNEHP